MSLHVIILAAGKGTRMKSALPKVLHQVAGRSMLQHVIDTSRRLNPDGIHVVVGHGSDQVAESIQDSAVQTYLQAEQLGTGHAVMQALPGVPDHADVLILYGDVPLTREQTMRELLEGVSGQSMGLLTFDMSDPTGYGRIIRDQEGNVTAIIEQKDASEAQLSIQEINTGIMAANATSLKKWLPELSNSNAQGEYYLTDIIEMAVRDGLSIAARQPKNEAEIQGVNNRVQLSEVERAYQRQEAEDLMLKGCTLADPERIDIRGRVTVGEDIMVDINTIFEGDNKIGNRVSIGANCVIINSTIEDDAVIEANSIIQEATVGQHAQIGPFARIRPGTELADHTKVGNFVETKKAKVASYSKINHLSYVGDALVGEGSNIGAGTITCNYDGANKHLTEIGDRVFIGSNSALVAPVKIEDDATVGAGSTITSKVDKGQLAVARSRQKNLDGWKKPVK